MAAPSVRGQTANGSIITGTTSATATLPTYSQNDIIMILVESQNETADVPDGYTEIFNDYYDAGAPVQLQIFVKRAGASESSPSITGTTNHIHIVVATIQGCATTGSPWATGTAAKSAVAAISVPSITTDVNEALVFVATALTDNADDTENLSGYTNSNLTSTSDYFDQTETTGTGGGLGLWSGVLTNKGATGTTSLSHDNNVEALSVHVAFYNALPPKISHSVDAQLANAYSQPHYRIRAGDTAGLNADSDWAADIDVDATIDAEKVFRIRFEVAATSAGQAQTYKLQYSRNGGAWTDCAIRTLGTRTNMCDITLSSQYVNEATTTNLLSGSGLTFVTGYGLEDDNSTPSITVSNGHTELEWALFIPVSYGEANVQHGRNSDGDTFQFRVVGETYGVFYGASKLPTVTLNIPNGLLGGCYPESPRKTFVADSNGTLYHWQEYAETSAWPILLRSGDGGDSWTRCNGGLGEPADTQSKDMEGADAKLQGNVMHLIATRGTDTTYHQYAVSSHATTPDQWIVKDEIVSETDSPTDQIAAICPRSDGSAVAMWAGGTGYHIWYRIRSSGGTWGTATELDTASANFSDVCMIKGASDKTHIFYFDQSNGVLYHRSLTSADSFSGRETVDTGLSTSANFEKPIVGAVYYDDDGAETIMVAYEKNTYIYSATVVNDGTPGNVQQATSVAVRNHPAGAASQQPVADIANDSKKVYLLYADSSTADLWRDSNDDAAGWGTDVELMDATSIDYVRGQVFTHSSPNGGAKVYGFVYDTGAGETGFIRYNEYALVTTQTYTKTTDIQSLLKKTYAPTWDTQSLQQKRQAPTWTIQSLLQKRYTPTTDIQTLQQKRYSPTWYVQTFTKKTVATGSDVETYTGTAGTTYTKTTSVQTYTTATIQSYPVQNLQATAVSPLEISLAWDDVTQLSGEEYDIERRTTGVSQKDVFLQQIGDAQQYSGFQYSHEMQYHDGKVFITAKQAPGKLLRLNSPITDLSDYSSVTFANDGHHDNPWDMVYESSTGKLYVLFMSATEVNITEVDPSTLNCTDRVNDTAYGTGTIPGPSITCDGTYLYVMSYISTNSQVIRYRLSDWGRQDVTTLTGHIRGHCIRYDSYSGNVFGSGNPVDSAGWIVRINPSNMSYTVQYLNSDEWKPTDEMAFTDTYAFLGLEGGGYTIRVLKSDMTQRVKYDPPPVTGTPICYGVWHVENYIWQVFGNSAVGSYARIGLREEDGTLVGFYIPENTLTKPNELTFDGAGHAWISDWSDTDPIEVRTYTPLLTAPIDCLENTAAGGTDTVAVTTGNSGGGSGDAWDAVSNAYYTSSGYSGMGIRLGGHLDWNSTRIAGTLGKPEGISATWTFKYPGSSGASYDTLLDNDTGGEVRVNNSGYVTINDAGGTVRDTSSAALSSGSWYKFRLRTRYCETNATNGYMELAIYNNPASDTPTEVLSATCGTNSGAGFPSSIQFYGFQNGATWAVIDSIKYASWTGEIIEQDWASTTYSDTGLVKDTEYHYRVRASEGANDYLWSEFDNATTLSFFTKTTNVQSVVKKVGTPASNVGTLLKKTFNPTSNVQSLQKYIGKPVTNIQSLLKSTKTASSNVEAYTLKEGTYTIYSYVQSLLKKTVRTTSDVQTYKVSRLTKTSNVLSLLQKRGTRAHLVDTYVQTANVVVKTTNILSLLKKTLTSTTTPQSLLKKTIKTTSNVQTVSATTVSLTKSSYVTARIIRRASRKKFTHVQVITKQATQYTKTGRVDVYVARGGKYHNLQSLVKKTITTTHGVDAYASRKSRTHSVDAYLSGAKVAFSRVDVYTRSSKMIWSKVRCSKKKTQFKTHGVDTYKQ